MGSCLSYDSPDAQVSDQEKSQHREAERMIKEDKAKLEAQVKVLLLGAGDSGKSTVLKQMRLIHNVPFSSQEIETFRQSIFSNLTLGMKYMLEAMDDITLKLSEDNMDHMSLIENAADLRDEEPFPMSYLEPLRSLWNDPKVQEMWRRRNESALPENLEYFYLSLDRLFAPSYSPTEQDILHCRIRTTGITETAFSIGPRELRMVDVGGQKSERRKWIHCFQEVASILFLVSLSGYDQCLVEDRSANQMQDAMTIWNAIYHSQWFKKTAIILFLNKSDLFAKKVKHSDIKNYFPDYEGQPGDVKAGREYFKRRYTKLATRTGQERGLLYTHFTTATDTAMLKAVMIAVQE